MPIPEMRLRCTLEAESPAVDGGVLRENIGFDEHGVLHVVVPRGAAVPASGQVVLSTTTDDQTELVLPVLRGNRMMSRDATALGMLVVTGLSPRPRGIAQVVVTLGVDGGDVIGCAEDEGQELAVERRP
jgi:molecular chaperone DnaK (HSP70)